MVFKKIVKHTFSIDSPEALLHDIRPKKIQGPLSHQADMWRKYVELAINKPNVALELPTGSGKTLVGLIIAEWRRLKFNEKVLYLCPTNQLVNQVVEQAENKYGLKVAKFTGKKIDYDSVSKLDYIQTTKIAVSSYSALFNSNPFFNDPDIIILDDAHSSENYISSLWSIQIEKYDDDTKSLFLAFSSLIKKYLSNVDYNRMVSENEDLDWVDKLPTNLLIEKKDAVSSLLDEYSRDNKLKYTWKMLKNNLLGCHCYLSSRSILIRPLIPPTLHHEPFKNAKQRIFMSATLGNGGDLERITGIKEIERLPMPDGWDKQGIGRRFYIFPERSLGDEDTKRFVHHVVNKSGRSVILTKSDFTLKKFKTNYNIESFPIYSVYDIEESKESFLSNEKAIAIIANRYDGLNFPENESHTLIIDDISTATNIQEKFFVSRMAANQLLHERLFTRIIQAMGRCTRSSTDYSAVIIIGEKLLSYILNPHRRSLLHPELQAEFEFGIQQSTESKYQNFIENFDSFINQDDNWQEAEKDIISLRAGLNQDKPDYLNDLSESVKYEVEFQYKLWQNDYVSALNCAKNVLSKLNHNDLKGYRALWSYLAGSVSLLGGESLNSQAISYFEKAMKTAPSLMWIASLTKIDSSIEKSIIDEPELNTIVDRFEKNNLNYLYNINKYDKEEKFIIDNIIGGNSKQFEEAHKRLGLFIGFEAGKIESDASPDPWWRLKDDLLIVFEDHSDATSDELNANKARQIATHDNWIRENLDVPKDLEIIKVIITPTRKASSGAIPHLKDVYLWELDNFKKWTFCTLQILRSLKECFTDQGDLEWQEKVRQLYIVNKISPMQLVDELKKNIAYDFYQLNY